MAKRDIEGELRSLAALRGEALGDETLRLLRRALSDKVNVIVAKAAEVAVASNARVLLPEMLTAYDRLFESPEKRDPQCWGKNALAKALLAFDFAESAPFVRGAQHYQWEPVWGGEADCASTLRATCILALPACLDLTRDRKMWHIMRGLTDRVAQVRLDAARAVEQLGGFEAALVLRLKSAMPETDPAVTSQVFESLLAVEGEGALPFLVDAVLQRGQTEKDAALAEAAALAMGASRLPAALRALMECRATRSAAADEVIFQALSISRTDEALEFLLALIRNARDGEASEALSALSVHRDSPEIARRVEEAVDERDSAALRSLFQRYFGGSNDSKAVR